MACLCRRNPKQGDLGRGIEPKPEQKAQREHMPARALLRQPEVVIGTWRAARAEDRDLTEVEAREALERLDPLWEELVPAEQARIVRLLVERVDVSPTGADIRLRLDGLASLMRDLRPAGLDRRAA